MYGMLLTATHLIFAALFIGVPLLADGGGHDSSGGGHYSPGIAILVVDCGVLKRDWPSLRSELKLQFDLPSNCSGVPGHFAQSAWILKFHFPKYYRDLRENVVRIHFIDKEATFAAYAWQNPGVIALYRPFGRTDVETALSLLVHETAHLMPSTPEHVTCVQGSYGGQGKACDQTLSGSLLEGSYSYELWFLVEITTYKPTADFKLIKLPRIAARLKFLLENKFNEIPRATLRQKIIRIIALLEE